MALSACSNLTDIHDREMTEHGSVAFPIAIYHDDLTIRDVPWHWHDEWEFAIVSEGEAEFRMENGRIPLKTGEGIFVNSKALHGVEGKGRLHSGVFHPRLIGGNGESIFHEQIVQPMMSDKGIRYILLHPSVDWENHILFELEKTWEILRDEPEDFENEVRYHISKAMGILVRNCDFTEKKLSEQELLKAEQLRKMLEFIEAHFQEDITLTEIAEAVSISTSACLRSFKATLGVAPIQYLKQYRIRKAAKLLETTNLTAGDVAMECGFNDVSYFTKTFREMYGCTPKAYQRRDHE